MAPRDAVLALEARMSRAIGGGKRILDRIVPRVLANAPLLVEGLPGLAKGGGTGKRVVPIILPDFPSAPP